MYKSLIIPAKRPAFQYCKTMTSTVLLLDVLGKEQAFNHEFELFEPDKNIKINN
jgi:hypothetical protein